MVEAFARHVIQRYGEAEVHQWLFECWNEPNQDAGWIVMKMLRDRGEQTR